MSTTVEQPTTVRELTRYVQDEHPSLDPSYHSSLDQLLVVGQPERPEPPAALREVLGSDQFEMQDQQVTGRAQWVAIVNAADTDDGGDR